MTGKIILFTINLLLDFVMIYIFFKFRPTTDTKSKATVFDQKQNYRKVLNAFIRHEFLFELKQWIETTKNTKLVSSDFSSAFEAELVEKEGVLQKKLSIMTASIISKMSTDMKNAFYREYALNYTYYTSMEEASLVNDAKQPAQQSNGDMLYIYVARILEMYCERVITELEVLRDRIDDKAAVINNYLVELNNALYMSNDIFVVFENENNGNRIAAPEEK